MSDTELTETPRADRADRSPWQVGGGDAPTGYAAPGMRWPQDIESNPVFRMLVFQYRRRWWGFASYCLLIGVLETSGVWIYMVLGSGAPARVLLPFMILCACASWRLWARLPVPSRLLPDQAWIELLQADVQARDVALGITAFAFSRPLSRIYTAIGWAEGIVMAASLAMLPFIPWYDSSGFGRFLGAFLAAFLVGLAHRPTLGGMGLTLSPSARWWAGLLPFRRETKRVVSPLSVRSSQALANAVAPPWIMDPPPPEPEPLPAGSGPRSLFGHIKPGPRGWRRFTQWNWRPLLRLATLEAIFFSGVMFVVWGGPYHVPAVLAISGVCVLETIRTQRQKAAPQTRVNEWGAPVALYAALAEPVRQAWERIPQTEGYKRAVQSRGDR